MSQFPQQMPPMGGPAMKPHRESTVLVFGILGIVLCPVLAPFAWIMGSSDLKKMDAGSMDPAGRDRTKAGMICGIIGTVLLGLTLLYFIFMIVLVGGLITAGASAA